jgi:hypothetical protein
MTEPPEPNLHSDVKQPERPKLLQVLGPGLITGASDDDPSGIATYSQAGAQFGFDLSWVMLFSWPLMCAIQEISARIGRVTGRGIAGNLKRHYPLPVVYSIVFLLVVANVINIGADLGAMGAALKLLIGGNQLFYVAAFGLITVLLEVFSRYSRYVSILKWLTLSLFAYVGVTFVVHMPWGEVARSLVVPQITFTAAYMTVVVAILGTTISPYLFFWQAEEEVEEVKERPDAKPLERAPEQATQELKRIRIDTYVGMGISNLVALFIILTTAATLHAHGITDLIAGRRGAETYRRPLRLHGLRHRHHRHRPAGAAGAGRIVSLRPGRDLRLARGPGPQAQPRQGVLRRHRCRYDAGHPAQRQPHRPDQGAVLERGDQRHSRRACDGPDDAPLQPQGGHGRFQAARGPEDRGLDRHGSHGRRSGRPLCHLGEVDPPREPFPLTMDHREWIRRAPDIERRPCSSRLA